jgi:hypothetical protein
MSVFYGTPGSIHSYVESQKGIQLSTRFNVIIKWPGAEEKNFMCDMSYLPAKQIKIYNDLLSGSASPLPIPFGLKYPQFLMQFIIEETWASRKYFEDWMSAMFGYAGGSGWLTTALTGGRASGRNPADVLNNKVRYYDDVAGSVQVQAISSAGGKGGEPIVNATYVMTGCIPIELIPTKFDAAAFNTPMRYSVNMLYRTYNLIVHET